MPWGAVAGAVVGGLASMDAAGTAADGNRDAAQINKAPWEKQQPYVLGAYDSAQTAFNGAQATGNYQGPWTAGLDPMQTQGLNTLGQFGQNQGMGAAGSLIGAGNASLGAGAQFGQNAASLYGQVGQDPTQHIIGNAGQYAANPYIDGMVDAASRDVTRNLNEQQLPGLDMTAAATGNMDSTRTGVAQGIMQRGAADRIGDISAQLHGQAYQTGLGMSQNQYNAGVGQQFNANGQLLQAGTFGANTIGQGLTAGYAGANAMTTAGAGFQGQAQTEINNNLKANNYQQNNGMDLVAKYLSSINGQFSGGGAQYTPTGSPLQGALSGALGGAGLMDKLGGMQGQAGTTDYTPGALGSGTYGMLGATSPATTATATTPLGGSPMLANANGLGSGFSNLGASGTVGSMW